MIDLHYWPTPNGHKVSIALEELGLPYRLVPVNIGRGEQFRPEFLAISPNNRMPAIVDDEPRGGGAPISVFESGAILVYLAEKTGRLIPGDPRGRIEALEWTFWQVAGLGPMMGQAYHFLKYAPERIPYATKRYTDEVNRLYGVLDRRLQGREWLAGGEYGIADIASFPWARTWKAQEQDIALFPNVARWLERIESRGAVERGLAVGAELRIPKMDDEARKHLFGQTAKLPER
jgi:GST-like protein